MPIYSNNRTGSMALAQVAANESYTSEDFGRILYESQLNDMAFFEAVLACDFKEIKGLREGTILEAEVSDLNKASRKSMIDNLVTRLKGFWAKIKAAFKNAIDKIAAYALRDGKAFIRNFNEVVKKRIGSIDKWNGSIDDVVVYDYKSDVFNMPNDGAIQSMCATYSDETGIKSNEIVKQHLSALIGKDVDGVKGYTTEAMNKCKKTESLNKSNVNEYLSALDGAKEYIANLKKAQRNAEATVNNAIGDLKSEVNKGNVASLNQAVSAYETIIVAIAKTNIAATKADVKCRRAALSKVMSDIGKQSKELKESAVLDAIYEVECALDYDLVLSESDQSAVAKLIAAAV